MSDPWLTLIGIGEDGPEALSDASRDAIANAQIVFGGARHLALAGVGDRGQPWPLPFSVDPILAKRGEPVVVLASGDPFWHGVGGTLAQRLDPSEWRCLAAPSCVSLAASRMGWRLEAVQSVALHAAPFETLVPMMANGTRILCTLRDGKAPQALCDWLGANGFGGSAVTVFESLGGADEQQRTVQAGTADLGETRAPVMAAIHAAGDGLSQAPGRAEGRFAHDGQITKSPMRALTLAALAPRLGDHLWDLGAGSGSVSVEWALSGTGCTASAVELREDRCANIAENIRRFGLAGKITVKQSDTLSTLGTLPAPDAVFIGGGLTADLLTEIWSRIPEGTRLVANAVTLGSQTLLSQWHEVHGGTLLRIDIAQAEPLGQMQGWAPARPQLQWSTTR